MKFIEINKEKNVYVVATMDRPTKKHFKYYFKSYWYTCSLMIGFKIYHRDIVRKDNYKVRTNFRYPNSIKDIIEWGRKEYRHYNTIQEIEVEEWIDD